MAQFFKIHPDNPQTRLLQQTVGLLQQGAVIAWPTDSCYALACLPNQSKAIEKIFTIRQLQKQHDLTYLCPDISTVGQLAKLSNPAFKLIKRLTPGPWTFILPASRDVPKQIQDGKRKTMGVRIPAARSIHALLELLDAPLLSSSLILPGEELPETDAIEIDEKIGKRIELVAEAEHAIAAETTVLDLTGDVPVVVREGLGDISLIG